MITIDSNTKIGEILKQHPDALEAIVSISPIFSKLRNPILRKVMAPRTSVGMASKIAGCSVNDFFEKLQPLGFKIDESVSVELNLPDTQAMPEELHNITSEKIVPLDVRPVIHAGQDPLNLILNKLKEIEAGQVLKLINSFEPIPLIQLLSKKGFKHYVENIDTDTVITYFSKTEESAVEAPVVRSDNDWDGQLSRFAENMETIDVRDLEMPLPMLTILETLDHLPPSKALFVYHKRVPVFLLPELAERKFAYRVHEIDENEVHLLIFKE